MSGDARTIVVTGATRGLGRALAGELLRRGHVVHGCGVDATRLAQLMADTPEPSTVEAVDVADADAVAAWAGRILEHGAVPDLVVNNAGMMNGPAPLWEVPAEEFDRLMAVNVGGVANVIRAFVPAMVEAGRGVLANLSSGWGRSTSPSVAPYCASKWAVEGLTRALAQDLPAGLAAVAVNPGIIDTDMLRTAWGDQAATFDRPESWAPRAADLFLGLGPDDNGAALTV